MAFEHNDQVTMASQTAAAAGAETLPPFGSSYGRDLIARLLPPLLAQTKVANAPPYNVTRLALVHSTVRPDGVHYEWIDTAPLGGTPSAWHH